MSDASPAPSERALAEASVWRARLTELDCETSPAFEDWLAASNEHRAAWAQVEAPWALLVEHGADPRVVALRRAALARAGAAHKRIGARSEWRARFAMAAVILVCLSLGAIGALSLWRETPRIYATELGERRSIALSDGSRVSLDSETEVTVRFTEEGRSLELRRGQARFDVAHDAARPFSVRAREQTVIALGTAFNIDIADGGVIVTMIEGRARVLEGERGEGDSDTRPERVLVAGEQLGMGPGAAPTVELGQVARAVAWERGQLDFIDEPLSEVARRVSRYTQTPVLVRDPALRDVRISGVVNTGDVGGFTELVAEYLEVEAVRLPNGSVELRSKRAA